MAGQDFPWFSSLRWWQKLGLAAALFVVFMTVLLLPRNVSTYLIVSAAVVTLALSFFSLRAWQSVVVGILSSLALTALLLLTKRVAPYGIVAVAVMAVALSVWRGWKVSRGP